MRNTDLRRENKTKQNKTQLEKCPGNIILPDISKYCVDFIMAVICAELQKKEEAKTEKFPKIHIYA